MTFFYNLNKKLDEIRATPETTHTQLNERDEGKPGKNFAKIAKDAGERYGSKEAGERVAGAVRAKLAKQGKLEEAELDEGFVDTVKSGAQAALSAIGQTLGHGSDEDMIRDLQKKAGVPVTGKVPPQQPGQQPTGQQPVAEKTDPVAFAALAEPKDKITFADKIAGAKKEVDEMLGDVAAEAMKNALRGKQQVADEGNAFTGKLKSTPKGGKFKMGNKEYTDNSDIDEGWDDMLKDVKARREKTKKGEITHGHKHDIEDTGTGRRVTRRTDPNTGYSVGAEDDKPADGEKRGRGRPKKADKAPERVTAKAYKHKGGRKEKVKEGPDEGSDLVKLSKVIQSCKTPEQLKAAQRMAQSFLAKHNSGGFSNMKQDISRLRDVDATLAGKRKELGVEERKLSSSEKEEREDIVKGMKKNKGDFEKRYGKRGEEVMYATATKMAKERGPGNPDRKKKEKTEETTVAGSVAPSAGGKAKKGGIVGKGIYDSINRELEDMISESMNVSVNMSMDEHGEPRKNITVSAEGEAAEQLAQLLNLAGMAAQEEDHGCGCETSPCSCGSEEELDENQPDWPTDQVTTDENDPEMRLYSGGLNGPKSTGQTTGAPFNRQPQRQGVMAEGSDLGMKLYAELKSFKG